MYCIKCGQKIADGAAFCPNCGAVAVNVDANKTGYGKKVKTVNGNAFRKKRPFFILVCVIVAAAIALIAALALHNKNNGGKTVIDMNKYLNITVNGENGYGIANASFDREGFIEDYKDKIKLDKSCFMKYIEQKLAEQGYDPDSEDYKMVIEEMEGQLDDTDSEAADSIVTDAEGNDINSPEYIVAMYFDEWCEDGNFDKFVGLSNGDTILYTWGVDTTKHIYGSAVVWDFSYEATFLEDLEAFYGCTFQHSDFEYTVKGLE